MKLLRDLFWRLVRKPSTASCSEQETEEEYEEDDLLAYIVIGYDKEGESFVSCNFESQYRDKIANLIFLIASGSLMEELVESVKQGCDSEMEAQMILQQVALNLKLHEKLHKQARPGRPAIRPTEVFRQGDRSDFKG